MKQIFIPETWNGKTAEQWNQLWLDEKVGREKDKSERGLYRGWERKCNGKRYGLVGVGLFFGKVMVWLYEDGTNHALHIPLATLAKAYKPIESYGK